MSTKSKKTSESKNRKKLNTGQLSDRQQLVQEFLDDNIIGQPGLIGAAVRAYGRGVSVIRRPGRPIYVVFALGKRGTGKTMTPGQLAKFLHNDEEALTTIRCGAYKEPHRVAQLVGAPASYVGYKDPDDPNNKVAPDKMDKSAKLTRHNLVASRKGSEVPVSIVVVDEVEKAIEELEDVLLSIMWEGRLDLGNNDVTEFDDCIIWLTGNVAADELSRLERKIGFVQEAVTQDNIEDTVHGVLSKRYKPEFLDRIDEIVIAREFDKSQMRQIVGVHAKALRRRLQDTLPRGRQFDLVVDEAALDKVLEVATKNTDSARGIVRAIETMIEDPLGNELTKGTINLGDLVEVTYEEGDELSFYVTEEGGSVSEADTMTIFGDRDAGVGLGMQRRTAMANAKAKQQEKKLYRVRLTAESDTKLASLAATVQHEAKEIFGLAVRQVLWTSPEDAPNSMDFVLEGIDEQIELFVEEFKITKAEPVDSIIE